MLVFQGFGTKLTLPWPLSHLAADEGLRLQGLTKRLAQPANAGNMPLLLFLIPVSAKSEHHFLCLFDCVLKELALFLKNTPFEPLSCEERRQLGKDGTRESSC